MLRKNGLIRFSLGIPLQNICIGCFSPSQVPHVNISIFRAVGWVLQEISVPKSEFHPSQPRDDEPNPPGKVLSKVKDVHAMSRKGRQGVWHDKLTQAK